MSSRVHSLGEERETARHSTFTCYNQKASSRQAASRGALPSAEQGAASHRHLPREGFVLLIATGRISRSPPRSNRCCLHTGRRGTGVLTSRLLMKTNGEAGTHNVIISRACSAQAAAPGCSAGWRQGCRSDGQHASPELRSLARLGNPSASVSPGLRERLWKHFSFWSAGKSHTFR